MGGLRVKPAMTMKWMWVMTPQKIGFGGGCHWCTEAVFQALKGVLRVEQGWIAAPPPDDAYSEAVIVHYDPAVIDLGALMEIHLRTHSSASDHVLRGKYRSAVYVFTAEEGERARACLSALQGKFDQPLVTRVLDFRAFKASDERYQNYFEKNADGPFCKSYIDPKLNLLFKNFRKNLKDDTRPRNLT